LAERIPSAVRNIVLLCSARQPEASMTGCWGCCCGGANDTAQGQALGTLASCAVRTLALTGTYSGGYADEAFNNLFRLNPTRMLAEGFEYGGAGVRAFNETYGVLERVRPSAEATPIKPYAFPSASSRKGGQTYEALPANTRRQMLENIAEWKALTTSHDAFPKIGPKQIERTTVPVLMMCGEKPAPIHELVNAELARLFKANPRAKRITISGATHEMWSEQPEICRKAVFEFLGVP